MPSDKRNNTNRGGIPSSAMWKGKREEKKSGASGVLIAAVILVIAIYFTETSLMKKIGNETVEMGTSSIRISEIMSDNVSTIVTENGDVSDWIEIENIGNETVDIGGYALMPGSNVNKIYTFPAMQLAPGAYAVVYADGGTSGKTAPFRLPASGGETLLLLNAGGAIVDEVMLPELKGDTSYCRNSAGEWEVTGAATPGASNRIEATTENREVEVTIDVVSDVVRINEVMTSNTMYMPAADGNCYDYIEIYNESGNPVDLGGWYLSDDASNLKKWTFPRMMLSGNAYLTVYCTGEEQLDGSELRANFRLSGRGEQIYLTRPDGKCVSKVSVPALADNQAYSYDNGAWTTDLAPTPGLENTMGAAVNASRKINGGSGLILSEIMAVPTSESCDWIEMYNGSDRAVDLGGFGLSDNAAKPRKYQFPSGTMIQPGEYKLITLTGDDRENINGYTNANFALSSEGGYTVSLSSSDGTILDAIYMPQQFAGISYGRVNGTFEWRYFEGGTPGTANSGSSYAGKAARATISNEGGLYKSGDSFTVELSAPAGSRIYYTLDSSEPDTSSTLYGGPISVNSTTILRTRVYADGYLPSYIDTHSYIFDPQTQEGVYVVSLVSDLRNLTSDETGIMVAGNGTKPNYQQNWEREASFELFSHDGRRLVGTECGISLHGADSRELKVKSFNVIARSEYGNNRIRYPIFKERNYTEFKSILLRPSGEDYRMSFMRDTLLSSLMKDSSLMYQKWELSVCYLDGKYYTLYYIRERITPDSICQFEGWEGMEDDIDVVRGNSSTTHGSNETFKELLSYVKSHDTSDDSVFAYVEDRIDIQNYIEYMSIEIFSGNTDLLNVRRYRNAKADGKWRWALYDLDWAFYNDTDSIGKWLNPEGVGASKATDTTLFIACMKNAKFRDRFLTYFGHMMATVFSTENVTARITERNAFLADLLPAYEAKWDVHVTRGMRKVWNYAVDRPTKLLKEYFPKALHMSEADVQKYFGEAIAKIDQTHIERME